MELVGPNGLLNQLTKNVLERRWTRRCLSTSAMTSTIRPGAGVATHATAPRQDGVHRDRAGRDRGTARHQQLV